MRFVAQFCRFTLNSREARLVLVGRRAFAFLGGGIAAEIGPHLVRDQPPEGVRERTFRHVRPRNAEARLEAGLLDPNGRVSFQTTSLRALRRSARGCRAVHWWGGEGRARSPRASRCRSPFRSRHRSNGTSSGPDAPG